MDVIFVWTWECPLGYDGSQRTTTFHQTKSCHIYLSFAAQHFHDLYCCFKYIEIDFNVQKIVSHMNGKHSTKSPTQKCPIFFSISKRNDFKLKKSHWITLSYINQQCSLESEIAPWKCTPHPVLLEWYELVGLKGSKGNELDYIDLLDFVF